MEIFVAISLLILFIYILHMERKATVKRNVFRWYIVLVCIFVIIYMGFTLESPALLIFGIPAAIIPAYIWIKYTRFCEWCGYAVQTNWPLNDKENCSRCGSKLLK
jgi:hypothetical protein